MASPLLGLLALGGNELLKYNRLRRSRENIGALSGELEEFGIEPARVNTAITLAQEGDPSLLSNIFNQVDENRQATRDFSQRLAELGFQYGQGEIAAENQLGRDITLGDERAGQQVRTNVQTATELAALGLTGGGPQRTPAQQLQDFQANQGIVGDRKLLTDGQGNIVATVPVRGSQDWVDAQEDVQQTEFALKNITAMIDTIENTGFNVLGEDEAIQQTLYQAILPAVGKLADLGTLQPGDVARIQAGLPNPAEPGLFGGLKFRSSVIANYRQLEAQFRKLLEQQTGRYAGYDLDFDPTVDPDYNPAPGRLVKEE